MVGLNDGSGANPVATVPETTEMSENTPAEFSRVGLPANVPEPSSNLWPTGRQQRCRPGTGIEMAGIATALHSEAVGTFGRFWPRQPQNNCHRHVRRRDQPCSVKVKNECCKVTSPRAASPDTLGYLRGLACADRSCENKHS